MIEAVLNFSLNDNPCLGCTSSDCRTCVCVGEKEMPELLPLRVPQKKERKKPATYAAPKDKSIAHIGPLMEELGIGHETVRLPREIFGDLENGAFILCADGNGMRNAGILSGDQIIFERKTQATSGDIIVAKINGTLMCRRIFFEDGRVRVRREDGETPDIITTDCVIYGIMVGLARNCRKAG